MYVQAYINTCTYTACLIFLFFFVLKNKLCFVIRAKANFFEYLDVVKSAMDGVDDQCAPAVKSAFKSVVPENILWSKAKVIVSVLPSVRPRIFESPEHCSFFS